MLVLTRRKEETIIIGESIEVTVLGIRGEQVRLGISAPPEVPVHRKEVYNSLALANRTAQASAGPLKNFLRMISGKRSAPRPGAGGARRPHPPGGHSSGGRRRDPS
jgi:carbon storage regulator